MNHADAKKADAIVSIERLLVRPPPDGETSPALLAAFEADTLEAFRKTSASFMPLKKHRIRCTICGEAVPAGETLPLPFTPTLPGISSIMVALCCGCIGTTSRQEIRRICDVTAHHLMMEVRNG